MPSTSAEIRPPRASSSGSNWTAAIVSGGRLGRLQLGVERGEVAGLETCPLHFDVFQLVVERVDAR